MSGLLRLALRRHRVRILAWLVPLTLLMLITPVQYEAVYPDLASRAVVVEQMQHNTGTTLLYGVLPDPGTIGQMALWETGAYVMILAGLMSVLLAVALSRGDEDAGGVELVRACGLPRRAPLTVAVVVLLGTCVTLAALMTLVLGLETFVVDELTWSGAVTFGCVLALATSTLGLATLALGQLPHDAHGARRLGLALLGVSFLVRAVADAGGVTWLRWLSPLGWKDVVAPYTLDRWWALPAFLVVTVLAGVLAWRLDARRELGNGLLRARPDRVRHARVVSSWRLAWRLSRGSVVAWTISLVVLGALFGSMTRSMQEVIQESRQMTEMMAVMTGIDDPIVSFFSYLGTMVGLVVGVYATMSVLTAHQREDTGLTDLELTTGPRRWAPLGAQALVTVVGATVVLVCTGVAMGLIAEAQLPGHDSFVRSLTYVAGNLAGVVTLVGITALVVALLPKHASLAWVVPVVSPVLTLFGQLLELPSWLVRLSVLGQVPDVAGSSPDWMPLVVLVAVGVVALAASLVVVSRRDILNA